MEISPTITQLNEAIQKKNFDVLNRFWDQIAQDSAPLVETIADNPDHLLVTFIYRAQEPTKNVVLNGYGFSNLEGERHFFKQLGTTDLWYNSYRVPSDLRMLYSFASDVTPVQMADHTFSTLDFSGIMAKWECDSYNKKTYTYPKGVFSPVQEMKLSVLELPEAKPSKLSASSQVPKGNLTQLRFQSSLLGNTRNIHVYTPPGYITEKASYPLAFIFDGDAYLQIIPTPTILDQLISEGEIPPLVAVFVSNPEPNLVTRSLELPCYKLFPRFLVEELLPSIQEGWNVTEDAKQICAAGSSFGGLAAAYCAFQYPEVFGNVLSQSGAFWWGREEDVEKGWLIGNYVKNACQSTRFYLDVGCLETQQTFQNGPSFLESNRHFRDVLLAKGYSVRYQEVSGGHDYLSWEVTLPEGLIALLGKCSRR